MTSSDGPTDLTDLDDIRRELTVLAERLDALPRDAYDERLTVKMRQSELREAARRIAMAGDILSADQLERQIEVLRSRIEAHYGNRLSHSSGPQSGMGGGLDPRYLHEMNRAMDAIGDIDRRKAELRRLEDRLAAMRRSGD